MRVTLLIAAACIAPGFAQGLGADPAMSEMIQTGANGGFFVLAMYWLRQDLKASADRNFELCKDAMSRLERAYRIASKIEDLE